MNCQTSQTDCGTVLKIVAGSDFSFNIVIINTVTNFPVDVTTASEIVVVFPNADGTTYLELKLTTGGVTIVNGPGGVINVAGTAVQSAALMTGSPLAIDLKYTIAGKLTITTINGALSVAAPAYPAAP